ncbi:MAG: carbamate kinase, partial [Deltaproteobacteria bacterium]|nr:carbamate kinase [Deltaproteobacteria bacterium]
MNTQRTVVVAIGGNALVQQNQRGTFAEQLANVQESADTLAELVRRGYRLIVTHGNGPQVGNLYLRTDIRDEPLTAMPLDVCGAETQGQIGYVIETALTNALHRIGLDIPVVTVVTRVEVGADDPNFANPTKPVGPFYSRAELEEKLAEKPFDYIEDSGRGFRRVVASPEPVVILQEQTIRALCASGTVVIAGGGGGIPVVRTSDGLYFGVEAVIDKDRTAALLASVIQADFLLILTGVEKVAINFNKPDMQEFDRMTVSEAAGYLAAGQFPPGSMGPKMEAAMRFAASGKGCAVITTLAGAADALAGITGTRIVSDAFCSGRIVPERL